MCVIKLVYCGHCRQFYQIPTYRPSKRLDFVTIVDDSRCSNPECFYNLFPYPWQIELPIPGQEGTCGQESCVAKNCRIQRIYRLCDQFEENPYKHFALRKRNRVIWRDNAEVRSSDHRFDQEGQSCLCVGEGRKCGGGLWRIQECTAHPESIRKPSQGTFQTATMVLRLHGERAMA